MTPTEAQRLLRRIQDSMDTTHRLHQELLDVVHSVLGQQLAPVPSPAPRPATADRWSGRLYLDTRDAAEKLGLSPKTLEKWRWEGGGPSFIKLGGGVRYEVAELERWLKTRCRRSTSDPGGDH